MLRKTSFNRERFIYMRKKFQYNSQVFHRLSSRRTDKTKSKIQTMNLKPKYNKQIT